MISVQVKSPQGSAQPVPVSSLLQLCPLLTPLHPRRPLRGPSRTPVTVQPQSLCTGCSLSQGCCSSCSFKVGSSSPFTSEPDYL